MTAATISAMMVPVIHAVQIAKVDRQNVTQRVHVLMAARRVGLGINVIRGVMINTVKYATMVLVHAKFVEMDSMVNIALKLA